MRAFLRNILHDVRVVAVALAGLLFATGLIVGPPMALFLLNGGLQ